MIRNSLLLIGITFLISSCNFNFSASGSIRIDTPKDSLNLVYKNVQEIVNNMDHEKIKEELVEQFPNFDSETIKGSRMSFTKMKTLGESNDDANVFVRVILNCSPTDSEKAMEVIKSYESYIIDELKSNNINVIID